MGTIKTSKVVHIANMLSNQRAELRTWVEKNPSRYIDGEISALDHAIRLLNELIDGITYDPEPAAEYLKSFDLNLKHDHSQNSKKSVF